MLTPHIVKAKGNTYCYAWRGGPRMKTTPGEPGFEAECEAIRVEFRSKTGNRKLVLPTSKRSTLTLEDALWKAFDAASQRAKKRGLPFNLTIAYLIDRIEATKGRCELSGIAFDPRFDADRSYAHNPYGVSIDRIEQSAGYVEGNVRLILTSLNFAINQWGLDAYLRVARSVIERIPSPLASTDTLLR